MSLSAVLLDIAADPLAIAARLEQKPGFALVHDASARAGRSFVAVDPVETSSALLPPIGRATAESLDTRVRVPRWIGVIPYEAGRRLERPAWTRRPDERPAPHIAEPRWYRYSEVVEIDEALGLVRIVGEDPARIRDLAARLNLGAELPPASARLVPLEADEPESAHVGRVRRAKELIRAGDLYQVNLARRRRFAVSGSAFDVYRRLAQRARPTFGACVNFGEVIVCASSPELFLRLDPGRLVRTAPIKGTRPRGEDIESDERRANELAESAKERAELTMILDVERNDLGRVAVPGSVRLLSGPYIETHPTVHHRLAVVEARLRDDKTVNDLFDATFPSGSVTGAPKVRAMEVIATLEPVRRGLYTGAFGWLGFDGSLELAMAIRVLTIKAGEAHYFAGGGIVADSDPEAELAETNWKGAQLAGLT
jgi:anthranilate/para-aminobenzoate synthase component I